MKKLDCCHCKNLLHLLQSLILLVRQREDYQISPKLYRYEFKKLGEKIDREVASWD